jgi:glycosyltransferase involved in cell wall biosynthesis
VRKQRRKAQINYLSPVQMTSKIINYKILVISDYRAVGSSRPEAEIFIRLAQMGHEVHIISHPAATYYNQRFRSFGITVIESHPTKKISLTYIRFLRKIINEHQFHFVHAFNSKGLTNLVWAMKGLKSKLIAYRGYAGQTHWFDPMMYLKYFHPRVDHIICVSKDIENILAKNLIGAKHKLSTIPKGHDPQWYADNIPADRTLMGYQPEDILVCFLANVRPFKGLIYLLKATHLLPRDTHIHFLLIGHGYDDPDIQKQISESHLKENIHILGFRSDAREIVAASDCLIQTSTHGEGLSKSVVESMFLGIAPIITDIPGNKDLLEDGKSGWLIPPKDAEAIAQALTEMAEDKTERQRRGRNAKEYMHKHFHIDQTVEEFVNLYKRLLM